MQLEQALTMNNINVAFLVDYTHYIGGLNYLNNLLEGLADSGDRGITPYVFIGKQVDDSVKATFRKHATVIEHELFDRKSTAWLNYKIQYKLFGRLASVNRLMRNYNIDVVSHSDVCAKNSPYKTINWLPDFQVFAMPEMFTWFERFRRNALYKRAIALSHQLILSSADALDHLEQYYGVRPANARVLQFVASVDPEIYAMGADDLAAYLAARYGITGKYFYCPNQFWKHKNHLVLLKACKILKSQGVELSLVFSGREHDFRSPGHFESIKRFIAENGLQQNVKLLGLIPFIDVHYLMRNSVAVINPSRFEGWSTTVEEAKTIGKHIILSNLGVHREQAPPSAQFFDPTDETELASCLLASWNSRSAAPDFELERISRAEIAGRTKRFGVKYAQFIREVAAC